MERNQSDARRSKPVSAWWILAGLSTLLGMMALASSLGSRGQISLAPVGIVAVSGAISDSESRSLLGGRSSGSRGFIGQLEEAGDDPTIKAVVIRINSPGGAAAASQEMYQAVRRLRAKKPVFCSMGDVAASGGYYIASGCNKIYANGSTLTGSIGVISQFVNYQGLFRKLGLNQATIKSGRFKDAGNPARPLTATEKQLFQAMIMDVYNQFVDDVVAGRKEATGGKMTRAKVLSLADGRVYTGRQAKANGLVDELGGLYDAVQAAGAAVGVQGKVTSRDLERDGGGLSGLLGLRADNAISETSEVAARAAGEAFAAGLAARLKSEANSSAPQLRSMEIP